MQGIHIKKRLHECAPYADLAEVRLDALSNINDLDIKGLVDKSPLPLVFTNRPVWEGGYFSGREEERTDSLIKAAEYGASFIDIELGARQDLRSSVVEKAKHYGCKVIVSFHDFSGTPAEANLSRVILEESDAGADIGKVVVTARDEGDVRRVLSLFFSPEAIGLPLIAFAMGPFGRVSRLACLALGSYLTFASHSTGTESAPGQIPVRELRAMVNYFWDPSGEIPLERYIKDNNCLF